MTKKLNLTVSDALAAKIEERRDYLGNLSGIFQEAVEEKIRKKEEFEQRLKGDESMEGIAERLRRERIEAESDYRGQGKEAGLRWAKSASYLDLQRALSFNPYEDNRSDRPITMEGIWSEPALTHYFQEVMDKDSMLAPYEQGEDFANDYLEAWVKGWMEAVEEFWGAVEEKVMSVDS